MCFSMAIMCVNLLFLIVLCIRNTQLWFGVAVTFLCWQGQMCPCVFVAETKCSILIQYWVGYDPDSLSSSSNTSPSSVSNPLIDASICPSWHWHESTLLKREPLRASRGTKRRPWRCEGIFPFFSVKSIQWFKPHWSRAAFP